MPIARSNNNVQTAIVTVVTLAAFTLLGAVLAYWTWTWFGPRPSVRSEPLVESAGRASSAGTLFGVLQESRSGEAPAGLPIKLIGVVSATGNNPSVAVMQVDAKGIVAVRVGEEVTPGIRLEKVFPDRVTLLRAGASETLALADRKKPVAPVTPAIR